MREAQGSWTGLAVTNPDVESSGAAGSADNPEEVKCVGCKVNGAYNLYGSAESAKTRKSWVFLVTWVGEANRRWREADGRFSIEKNPLARWADRENRE